jgi:hypothetical protein
MTISNILYIDPDARARALVKSWRSLPVHELVPRVRALALANKMRRLPADVHEAWLCMHAVVLVAQACGRG